MAYKNSIEFISDIDNISRLIEEEKNPKRKEKLKNKLIRLHIGYEKAIEREISKALKF